MSKGTEGQVVSLIVAMDTEGVIGDRGGLPWRHSGDMRYFRATTTGKAVILGRKTFQGLRRPLVDRLNIVLTRDPGFVAPEGVVVASTAGEALERAGGGEVFVAGGAEIYALFLPMARRLYVTRMAGSHTGDTRFPPVVWAQWRRVWAEAGEGCVFERYERQSAEAG